MKNIPGNIKKVDGYELYHDASSLAGSSGSPILLYSSMSVVAIHRGASKGLTKETQDFKGLGKATFIGHIINLIRKQIEFENLWENEEGFNCSSLVGAAFYHCGILQIERDTRGILPGKFAESKSDSYFTFNEILLLCYTVIIIILYLKMVIMKKLAVVFES